MLTDEEIISLHDAACDKYMTEDARALELVRTAIAAYHAKLLAGVEMPEPNLYADNSVEGYYADQLQQYATAAAAQARERALEQCLIKVTGISVDVERCKKLQLTTQAWEEALDVAADAIEQLKVKP